MLSQAHHASIPLPGARAMGSRFPGPPANSGAAAAPTAAQHAEAGVVERWRQQAAAASSGGASLPALGSADGQIWVPAMGRFRPPQVPNK